LKSLNLHPDVPFGAGDHPWSQFFDSTPYLP
jgi:hypothetical protein